ncbi:MAG: rhodanese-like domain-containing protein [Methanothrix sp.]|nr:rhodanese-like domain-containing protein [Methanothrix sp.]
MGVISIMGGGVPPVIDTGKKALAALLLCMICAACVGLLTDAATAGTETGEFCPTCPDWTNLDGWLAQKDAYEAAQMNGQNGQTQPNANATAQSNPAPAAEGYARPDLIANPAAIEGSGILLDVRSKGDYIAGHIPEARNIHWKSLQSGGILEPTLLEAALCSAGIEENDRIIIYGGPDEGGAFMFWALSYLGHENMSLLDGGVDAAEEAGLSLTTNAPSPQQSNYTARIQPSLRLTSESLESILTQSDVRILDGRDFSEYGQMRLGNESICLSLDKIYGEHSRIKSASKLKDLFERRLDEDATAVVYGTPEACSLFYSLRLMGYNATLIEGDWWKETNWAVRNVN